MGTLEDFLVQVNAMIQREQLNISVSGVALVVDESHKLFFSASLIVESGGIVPSPSEADILRCKAILQKSPIRGYTLRYINFVSALFKDEKLLRWQAQYAVSVIE